MKVTQIVYKVDDLQKGIEKVKKKNLFAEYGRSKNPYNAFVYFHDDTFIELVENTGIPKPAKLLMKVIRPEFIKRFQKWDNAKEGPLGIGIQVSDRQMLEKMKLYLKEQFNMDSFIMTSKRKDSHGVNMVTHCLFPEDEIMPFFVTPYEGSSEKSLHVNLNGSKYVKSVRITYPKKEYEFVKKLFDKFNLWADLGAEIRLGEFGFDVEIQEG